MVLLFLIIPPATKYFRYCNKTGIPINSNDKELSSDGRIETAHHPPQGAQLRHSGKNYS